MKIQGRWRTPSTVDLWHTHTEACTYTRTHKHMQAYTNTCIYRHTHTGMHAHTCMYAYTYTQTHTNFRMDKDLEQTLKNFN